MGFNMDGWRAQMACNYDKHLTYIKNMPKTMVKKKKVKKKKKKEIK